MAASDRIDKVWNAELEPDFHDYVVATARQVLREEQQKGFDPDPRTIVDRRPNARIETVKLFGTIEFVERAELGAIIDWIYRALVETSPVLKGDYARAHMVLVNGREATEDEWRAIGPGDRITFVNIQPYARRIEGGARFVGWTSRVDKTARKHVGGFSLQAPNGVYRVVFGQARRKFGKQVFLDYKFVSLAGGKVIPDSKTKRYRYPAIQLYQARPQ